MNKKASSSCEERDACEKLRVLQVAKWCSPSVGGIEKIVDDITDGLKARSRMKLLVCAEGKKTVCETTPDGIEIVRAGKIGKISSMPISLKYLYWFRKLSADADVIQFHAPFPLSDLALFLFHRQRAVTTVWWHSDVVRQKRLLFFYKPLMRWFLKHVDRIYVASDAIVRQSAHLDRYSEKIEVIPFGINEKEYLEAPELSVLSAVANDKDSVKLLFVGRLVYYKGVDVLFKAFDGVKGAELFIVGGGELEDELKREAAEAENSRNIHFLGSLDDASLKSAYRECDILVFPSVSRSECFGLVQLEAMVYGKPVINTRLDTAVPEVSRDGVSGVTVTPGDVTELREAIEALCADPSLRKKYGDAARQRVHKRYSIDKMSDRLFSSYERLYAEKRKKR